MEKYVYIDESGSPDLKDEHYVLSAIFTPHDALEHDLVHMQKICDDRCSGGVLKSSKVKNKISRRTTIAQEFLGFHSVADVLVIKKSRLKDDGGFPFRGPMYKFCQRRLFSRIYRAMENVQVVIDSFGRDDFRKGFVKYIDRNFQPTFFSQKNILFAKPDEEILLQASDFVAGTVRRYFDKSDSDEAYNVLRPFINSLEIWPRSITDASITPEDEEIDLAIRNHCTYAAEEFLESNKDKVLAEVTEYLLYADAEDHEGFIFGDQLLRHLTDMELIDTDRDKSWLRQKVIAELRENGVLIAASRDGYKIPENQKDVAAFVEFVGNKTIKYLKRVMKMRNSIFYGTGMKYEMLEANSELMELMRPLNIDNDT
ncbi:MAG: DUF3800 domain-containing protein [Deltaproteobacteria bacterium]|nr:DUF3800 domain-containing protein [Candidatus Tharpella sp.]